MSNLSKRLDNLERGLKSSDNNPNVWHQLVWEVGQDFDDMLDEYGRERIGLDDGVIIHEVIDAKDARPAPDPVHDAGRERLSLFKIRSNLVNS
ncbi:MAG: hypothetical protein ABJO01_10060 [Parasphingorhabdus sp.]|uniref:hypothetical protein n=1 Tax=Parasphingorhabdus sp. TaxID=2709688 RepID=UPI00329A7797